MNSPTYKDVHDSFKLNGFHFNREDLCRVAYSFIKEGEDFERPVGRFLLDWFDEKPYLETNTSGTTGKSKMIKVSKQAMVNSALATGDFFDLFAGNKALHCLPTKYIAGKMMFVRSFVLGLDLDFVAPKANPLENSKTIYDFAAMVPYQAQHSLNDIKRVKKIIIGGVYINKNLEKQLMKTRIDAFETYGMTETITHIAAKRIGEKAFTVLPNVTISYDENNCLMISAPRISDQIIRTNDLVQLVNENQFIFLGRFDNVVNSGGIKLIPEQIEEKILPKLSTRFFVGGLPDELLGEKLVMIMEGEKFDLQKDIYDGLEKYEKPKEVFFVKDFLETENGKVKRKEILKSLNA